MKESLVEIIEMFKDSFDKSLDFYTARFSHIIGVDFDYWVCDKREEDKQADRPTQPVDIANFGDYYFSLADIRTVVDNYKYWLKRYSTCKAVGQEVRDWHDYAVERMGNKKSYIKLFNWLLGAPSDIDDNNDVAADGRVSDENKEIPDE